MLNSIAAIYGNGVIGDYESIATTTVGAGGSSTITFSSIPATYQHLQLRATVSSSSLGWVKVRFNSDSGANYSYHELRSDGAGVSSFGTINTTDMNAFLHTSQQSSGIIDILDYANTNKYKTIRTIGGYDNNGSGYMSITSDNWRNTNAITSITITSDSTNYAQYSKFALYGIKG